MVGVESMPRVIVRHPHHIIIVRPRAVVEAIVDESIEMSIPRDVFSWNHREGILG